MTFVGIPFGYNIAHLSRVWLWSRGLTTLKREARKEIFQIDLHNLTIVKVFSCLFYCWVVVDDMSETIVLESDAYQTRDLQPPDQAARKMECVLRGEDDHRCLRELSLFNQQFVELGKQCKRNKPMQKVALHVGFLSPASSQSWIINYPLFLGALVGVFGVVGFGYFKIWWAAALVALVAGLLASVAIRQLDRITVIFSAHAHAPIAHLSEKCFGKQPVAQFTKHLAKHIAQHPLPKGTNALAEETKLLRRLLEAGFIGQEAYEQYRQQLLALYPKRAAKTA